MEYGLKRLVLGSKAFVPISENEYCAILYGTYDGKVQPNKDAVYEYVWLPKEEFIKRCLTEDKAFTPWAILTGMFLAEQT